MDVPFTIHNWDPVLLELWGPAAIRWYGLAYLAGFLVAYAFLMRWARDGSLRIAPPDVQSLMFYCIIGVMLGGRVGYLLFYDFPNWRNDPLMLVRVWEGGMASHGGLLGLATAIWLFSRTRHIPFLHVADGLVCAGALGIFFGRLANYINGELWGRVTNVRWAVIFPQEAGLFPSQPDYLMQAQQLYERGLIFPRHPSQLYAALVEGVLVWAVLMLLRHKGWGQRYGQLGVAFLVLYAIGRFTVEFFREPEIVYSGWLTQGQALSLTMLIPAIWVWRIIQSRNA